MESHDVMKDLLAERISKVKAVIPGLCAYLHGDKKEQDGGGGEIEHPADEVMELAAVPAEKDLQQMLKILAAEVASNKNKKCASNFFALRELFHPFPFHHLPIQHI